MTDIEHAAASLLPKCIDHAILKHNISVFVSGPYLNVLTSHLAKLRDQLHALPQDESLM